MTWNPFPGNRGVGSDPTRPTSTVCTSLLPNVSLGSSIGLSHLGRAFSYSTKGTADLVNESGGKPLQTLANSASDFKKQQFPVTWC
jgi:hypothetical protein